LLDTGKIKIISQQRKAAAANKNEKKIAARCNYLQKIIKISRLFLCSCCNVVADLRRIPKWPLR